MSSLSAAASSSSSSSASASSLSSALTSLPSIPSFSVQADWESVLREYSAALRGPAGGGIDAADRLPKESRQFWASAARFGDDSSQREAIARLEGGVNASSIPAATTGAATATAALASGGGSLAAAARAVRLNTAGPNSTDDLELQFRGPLQLLAHSSSLGITQLVQAPRAAYTHLHPQGDVFSVDINAQGTLGLSAAAGGTVRVWDASTGMLRADLVGHVGDALVARWFPSGLVALSAGLDLTIKIWAIEPAAALATQLVGHTRPVTNVLFIGRGRNLVSSSEDGTAKLWDVSRQAAISTYPAHKEDCPPKYNDCLLLDPVAHGMSFDKSGPGQEVSDAAGNLLLTAGSDGIVRGFDLRTSGQVIMMPSGGRAGGIDALAPGPRAGSFTLGTSEGAIVVVDIRNKQPVTVLRQDDAAITNLLPWSDDSFWSTNSTGAVSLWRLSGSSGSIVAQLSGVDCEPVHDMVLTASGSGAFVAAHGAVRSYQLSSFPAGADTHDFHGLHLPARKANASAAPQTSTPAAAADASAAAAPK